MTHIHVTYKTDDSELREPFPLPQAERRKFASHSPSLKVVSFKAKINSRAIPPLFGAMREAFPLPFSPVFIITRAIPPPPDPVTYNMPAAR